MRASQRGPEEGPGEPIGSDQADFALLPAGQVMSTGSSIGSPRAGTEPEAVFIASFAEFYRVHHPKIAKSLALNFSDSELGREAADEAMTRAYSNWGTVSGHNNPAGWVYRVGLNWGRSWFRRAGRRLPWVERSSTELPETSDPALRRALLQLDHKHRAVVVCRYFLDWSTNQTAAALEIPTGTVKSRLHQALAELRRDLTPDDDESSTDRGSGDGESSTDGGWGDEAGSIEGGGRADQPEGWSGLRPPTDAGPMSYRYPAPPADGQRNNNPFLNSDFEDNQANPPERNSNGY